MGLILIYCRSDLGLTQIASDLILFLLWAFIFGLKQQFHPRKGQNHAEVHKARPQQPKCQFYSHRVGQKSFQVPYTHKFHRIFFFFQLFLRPPNQNHRSLCCNPYPTVNFKANFNKLNTLRSLCIRLFSCMY